MSLLTSLLTSNIASDLKRPLDLEWVFWLVNLFFRSKTNLSFLVVTNCELSHDAPPLSRVYGIKSQSSLNASAVKSGFTFSNIPIFLVGIITYYFVTKYKKANQARCQWYCQEESPVLAARGPRFAFWLAVLLEFKRVLDHNWFDLWVYGAVTRQPCDTHTGCFFLLVHPKKCQTT